MSQQIPPLKTIGVIGGLGHQATIDILDRMIKACNAIIPVRDVNRAYPRISVEFMDQPPMRLAEDGSVPDVLEPHPQLLEAARNLGHTDFLIVASNTPHFFVKEIEKASGRPVLSMVDVTIEEVQRLQCPKVGVLAIGETLKRNLYQDRLDQLKIPWETIPEDLISELDESIWKVMEGKDPRDLTAPAVKAMQYLLLTSRQIYHVILGCTELPLLLAARQQWPRYIINPSQLLAEAAIREALK